MVKWIRITENQYLGFWVLGLFLFALQEVPYMVMPLLPMETNPLMHMPESSPFLSICEKALGSLCILFMTFIVQGNMDVWGVHGTAPRIGLALAATALALNYLGWCLYCNGHQSTQVMLLFIVLLPPLYYACIGLWRQNWPLLFTGILFGAVHFTHVSGNLRA